MSRFLLVAGVFVLSNSAFAQDEALPSIESVGTAVIGRVPDFAEFWFTFRPTATTLEDAVTQCASFEEALKEAVKEAELHPISTVLSGISIPNIDQLSALRSAKLRFNLPTILKSKSADVSFGILCDQIVRLAQRLNCKAEGPVLGLREPEPVEQEAIARATENALYKADAVADLMAREIYSVDRVSVESVHWNLPQSPRDALPDLKRVTCTARVSVVYLHTGDF